jgi:hypothetical protein
VKPALADLSHCPPGCGGHLDGSVHISAEQVIQATAYASEVAELYVSRERDDLLGMPAVRLSGSRDAVMTPTEALHLAAALTAEALAVLSTWQVER